MPTANGPFQTRMASTENTQPSPKNRRLLGDRNMLIRLSKLNKFLSNFWKKGVIFLVLNFSEFFGNSDFTLEIVHYFFESLNEHEFLTHYLFLNAVISC